MGMPGYRSKNVTWECQDTKGMVLHGNARTLKLGCYMGMLGH